jgi:hypothetical protein
LVASGKKAGDVLGWSPKRGIEEMIGSAADWHRSDFYTQAIRAKIGNHGAKHLEKVSNA